MSPYTPLACALAALGLAGAAGWQGYQFGKDSVIAAQASEAKLIEQAGKAAQTAAAEEIAKIRVTQTTIRQQAEKEIIREPLYMDCRHPEPVRRLLDAALTQSSAGAEPAGDRELPEPDFPF